MITPTARGTRRRLRALVARGYSLTTIADHAHLKTSVVYGIFWNRHHSVPAARQAIAVTFLALQHVDPVAARLEAPGVARHNRERARVNGWHPAAAWVDIDLDENPTRVMHSCVHATRRAA
jgi:hypothetical protein